MNRTAPDKLHPSLFSSIGCAFLLLLAIVLSWPVAETGISDDWSYIRTAQLLAQTGHVHYNGWATAMLGWQLLPGALFTHLFGASFTSARLSTMLLALTCCVLLHRCLLRGGLRTPYASLGTLAVVLSPLFLPLATTFMSDIAGLLAILVCLYCCQRALQATTSGSALFWIAAATLGNLVGGTARQIAWLGLLVMVPCTLWAWRRQRQTLLPGVALWLVSLATMALLLRWFHHQPYSLPEPVLPGRLDRSHLRELVHNMLRLLFETLTLALPSLVFPILWLRRRPALALVIVAVLLAGVIAFPHKAEPLLFPSLSAEGNVLSTHGLFTLWPLRATRPVLLTMPLRFTFSAVALLALAAIVWRRATRNEQHYELPATTSLAERRLWLLLGPFTLAYLALLIPRSAFYHPFDRYALPLLLPLQAALLLAAQRTRSRGVPLAIWAVLGCIAVYAIAVNHDLFATYRGIARIDAELEAQGVSATAIDAGWEADGWTQITTGGYLHDPRLHLPVDAAAEARNALRPCPVPFHILFPVVDARYTLSTLPDDCGGPTNWPAVTITTWLPLRSQAIFVVRDAPR